MDYATAFAISASGMLVARTRVDVTAVNLANAYSTRSADGTLFTPLQVVAAAKRADLFEGMLTRADIGGIPHVNLVVRFAVTAGL